MARLEEIGEAFSEVAHFTYVYIKEAHPEDEWQMEANLRDRVVFKQPTSFDERLELARVFVDKMEVATPTLVDDMTNTANACYAAWPERLYVIDTGGRIVYKGGMGPFYFDPDELEEFLVSSYGDGTEGDPPSPPEELPSAGGA